MSNLVGNVTAAVMVLAILAAVAVLWAGVTAWRQTPSPVGGCVSAKMPEKRQ